MLGTKLGVKQKRTVIANRIEAMFALYAGMAASEYSDTGEIDRTAEAFTKQIKQILKEEGI